MWIFEEVITQRNIMMSNNAFSRFKQTVEREIAAAGFMDSFNILHTALVSGKTGYGIEDLITVNNR